MTMYASPVVPRVPQRKVRFEAIGEAFNLVKAQAGTWVLTMLVFMAVAIGISMAFSFVVGMLGFTARDQSDLLKPMYWIVSMTSSIIQGAVSACLAGGIYSTAIKQVRGESISVGDLFSATGSWLPLAGAVILTQLATSIGFLLLILPGFLVSALLMLTQPIIVDKRVGTIQAMQMSWDAIRNDMWSALAFLIVAGLVAGLGVFACGVGLLFTMPILYVAVAIVYRDFFGTDPSQALEPSIQMPLPPNTPGMSGTPGL